MSAYRSQQSLESAAYTTFQQNSTSSLQLPQQQSLKITTFQQISPSIGIWFGTRGSEVQILSPRPFLVLGALEDEVEGLSVGGPDVCTIRRAVQKYHLKQL